MRLRVLLISLLLFSIVPKGTPTFAATATMSVIMPASANQGVNFSADLVVDPCSSSNIYAATIYLTFDKDVLNVVDADGNPVTQLTPSVDYPQVMENVVDNSAGTINYSAGSFGPHSPPTTIVTIYFKGSTDYGKKTTAVNFDDPNCAVLVDYTTEITPSSGLTLVDDTIDILDNIPPATPTGLSGEPGNNQVTLSWNENTEPDISKYKIYQASGETEPPDGDFALKTTVTHPTQEETITNLTNGTKYWYKITALDTSLNESIRSSALPLIPGKIPSPPTGVSATYEKPNIVITWTAPTTYSNGDPLTPAGYNVYRASGDTDPYPSGYTKQNTSLVIAPPYTSAGLVGGTTYWYRITALDTDGLEGDKGQCIPDSAYVPAPNPPTEVSATYEEPNIVITWTAPDKYDNDDTLVVAGYNVYRAKGNTDPYPSGYTKQNTSLVTASPYTDSAGLLEGATYWYRITALDADGLESVMGQCTPDSAYVPDTTPPTVVPPAVAIDNTHVEVVFSEDVDEVTAEDKENYAITPTLGVTNAERQTDKKKVKLTTTEQEVGVTYVVEVTNVRDLATPPNTISGSNTASFVGKAPGGVPNHPTGVIATYEEPNIKVAWTAPTQYTNGDPLTVAGYNVYRAKGDTDPYPSGYTKQNTSLVTASPYTDSAGLLEGATYWYRITAVDGDGVESVMEDCTPASATVPRAAEITTLEIIPKEIRIAPGETKLFAAIGSTSTEGGKFLTYKCEWVAVKPTEPTEPTDLGTIDQSGRFKAGDEEGEVTIKATYINYPEEPEPENKEVSSDDSGNNALVEIISGLNIDPATIKLKNSRGSEIGNRPFNPETDGNLYIHYDLSQQVPTPTVLIRIYDMGGNLIREIYGDTEKAVWNFKDSAGGDVPNGVYIYQITATNINGSTCTKAKLVGVFR